MFLVNNGFIGFGYIAPPSPSCFLPASPGYVVILIDGGSISGVSYNP